MPDLRRFNGICGRYTIFPCRLVWHSEFVNSIGSYPSDLLPSRRTIWHASSNTAYTFSSPLIGPGDNFGLPFGGFIGGFFNFAPPQNDIFTPQSHYIVNFCKIANRIDVAHIITQEEIDTLGDSDLSEGEIRIDVGEYILDAVAVLDTKGVVNEVVTEEGGLTEDELREIEETGETEDDRAFRKYFTLSYPKNRFITVERNKLGIEYRLDNGGPKAVSALKLAGTGEVTSASYRDGTSRNLIIKITVGEGTEVSTLEAGDTVYITYIAVKEHYIRQSISISWTIQAIAIPPACYGFPSDIKVSNYRFYTWNIEPDEPDGIPRQVSGWRCVETNNIPVNFTAPVLYSGIQRLADFTIGNPPNRDTEIFYINAATSNSEDIFGFIADRSTMPSYIATRNLSIVSGRFSENFGAQNNNTAHLNSEWWTRNAFTTYGGYKEASGHILFNMHSKALKKRDVDKFGLTRSMADQIQQDIDGGKQTFFPFMDDPLVSTPQSTSAFEYLDGDNTRFEPIQPVIQYTIANAEIECGVGGAIQLGYTGSPDDIITSLNFNSNIITEEFDTDTKIIVERHFSQGQVDGRFIALQGAATAGNALTCINDPSRAYAFVSHSNSDNQLLINSFKTNLVTTGLQNLVYRPDIEIEDISQNFNPEPSQFEPLLGYNGLLGDKPGYHPGRIVSSTAFATEDVFRYRATSPEKLMELLPLVEEDQIDDIQYTLDNNTITISLGDGYYGRTEIAYKYLGDQQFDLIIRIKSGNSIDYAVDSLTIIPSSIRNYVSADHRWMRGSTIEIYGSDLSNVEIENIFIAQLPDNNARDLIEDADSSIENNILELNSGLSGRLLYESNIMSLSEDNQSRLCLFFNDSDGGISLLESNDFGIQWKLQYGIVEPVLTPAADLDARNPFMVTSFESNRAYLFFIMNNKIFCKTIKYEMLNDSDVFVIQRFERDVLDRTEDPPIQHSSLYSESGLTLRRYPFHIAAGNTGEIAFLKLIGNTIDNGVGEVEYTELRRIESVDDFGAVVSETKTVKKTPVSMGGRTAFTRQDIETLFFSAFVSDKGTLRLFFNGTTTDNRNLIQCHFSTDEGINWYDNWEFIENDYDRFRVDSESKTQFIDQESNTLSGTEGDDPLSTQDYPFGIAIHGYITGENDADVPVEVDAPYVFYQPTDQKVFFFYILEGGLFCKIFGDSLIDEYAEKRDFDGFKNIIERETRSYFVDGNLESEEIKRQINDLVDNVTRERNENGNIIINYQFPQGLDSEDSEIINAGLVNFTADRNISPQRICAYEQPNGSVRVFYKLDNGYLRAAIWTGSSWFVEDMLTQDSEA